MAGITVVRGSQPIEYVEESSFGVAETDPAMNWIGLVESFSATETVEEEVINYLPDDTNAVDLQTITAEKVSEMHEVELSYRPQDFTFLQYFTGADGSLASDLTPIQFGTQDKDNGDYKRYFGCVGEEITVTISQDSVAEVDASFLSAATEDWSTDDYVGTAGSHASADTSTPHSYGDLGSVQWGGTGLDDSIESLSFTISNDLQVVKDPDSSLDSHIDAIAPVDREITVELSLTYSDLDMVDTIRSLTKQDLTFDLPDSGTSVSWTISDVAFPEANTEYSPTDLIADSLSSLRCTDLTYA